MNKKVSYILTAVLIAVVLVLGTVVLVNAKTMGERVSGEEVVISGCVLRFPPEFTGQPRIHSNDSHLCAGVTDVGISPSGRVRVVQGGHTPAVENPILFVVCQQDETLAARGIICGPSGGNDHTEFQFYDTKLNRPLNLKNRSDRMRMAGNSSNVWLGWVHAPGLTR